MTHRREVLTRMGRLAVGLLLLGGAAYGISAVSTRGPSFVSVFIVLSNVTALTWVYRQTRQPGSGV